MAVSATTIWAPPTRSCRRASAIRGPKRTSSTPRTATISVLVGVGDTAKGGTGTDQVLLSFSNSTVGVTYTLTAALVTLQNGTILDGFEQLEFAGGNGIDNVIGGALADFSTAAAATTS